MINVSDQRVSVNVKRNVFVEPYLGPESNLIQNFLNLQVYHIEYSRRNV